MGEQPRTDLFHIDIVNAKTGSRERQTAYPMSEKECSVMVSKMTAYPWRRVELVPAGLPRFRVEASTSNPAERTGYERRNLQDYGIAESRKKALELASAYWHGGYWIEIYDDRTGELLAGPINPEAELPAYIV